MLYIIYLEVYLIQVEWIELVYLYIIFITLDSKLKIISTYGI